MKLCVGIKLKLGIWFWTLKNTEPLGKFKPNLVQTNTFVWRNFKLPQMKDHAFFQGEIITIWRKYIVFFRITRPKASLCEKNESLFRWRAMPFSKGYDYEMAKSHWRTSLEPLGHFQPTLVQSIFGWGETCLFKMKSHALFQGNDYEIAKIHWCTLKSSLKPLNWSQPNFAQSKFGWRTFKFRKMKGRTLL